LLAFQINGSEFGTHDGSVEMHHRLEQGGLGNFLSQGITGTCRVVPTYLARR
jgi:hypothetical protein